jgi:hypothetical protein
MSKDEIKYQISNALDEFSRNGRERPALIFRQRGKRAITLRCSIWMFMSKILDEDQEIFEKISK